MDESRDLLARYLLLAFAVSCVWDALWLMACLGEEERERFVEIVGTELEECEETDLGLSIPLLAL